MWAKFLRSDRFCFISINNNGTIKNPFAMITNLSELHFISRRFIMFVLMKEMISMSYGSITSSRKLWRWMRLDLIFTMRNVYINSNPLTKFITPRNISQMITKITHENSHNCVMKRDPLFSLKESQWKLRQQIGIKPL